MAKILALDAYHSGSHRAVINAWRDKSSHAIELVSLPGRHWKWRMRHAALSFVDLCRDLTVEPDCIWCTDMLDLAAWRGVAPQQLRDKPHILYMHENQLLYPDQHKQQRDFHYAFTNYTSCCAADLIAWNSQWHCDQFIADMQAYLKRMPDYHLDVEQLRAKSLVLYPGFDYQAHAVQRNEKPLLLWAARWEWEKGPDILFDALARIGEEPQFELAIIGGDAKQASELFQRAEQTWQYRIKQWGYVDSGAAYWSLLHQADYVISTARHEFFGLAMVEACAAGARPIVPQRLSYPEVFAQAPDPIFYHDQGAGDAAALAAVLETVLAQSDDPSVMQERQAAMRRYEWSQLIPAWDQAISQLIA